MALTRAQKEDVVAEVSANVAKAEAVIFAEYRGLNVEAMTNLRKQARDSGVYLRVLKNSLAKRAIKGTSYEGLSDQLIGPLMYGISEDPVACAKVLNGFAKENDKLIIKGGALPTGAMDVSGISALASLPSRDELLSKLLGTMQAPIAKFVRTLNEVPTGFVRTVAALRDQKEQQAG
ncbi:MAG: 50S ribosomal protein L10 [Burkholderiaceae bacterium]